MKALPLYEPPFTITPLMVRQIADISEAVGRISAQTTSVLELRLRRQSRIRSMQGWLAIKGSRLSEEQIAAILDDKQGSAQPRLIQEARNVAVAHDQLEDWDPESEKDLLKAHEVLMAGLMEHAGRYRQRGTGIAKRTGAGIAPPASRLPYLMGDLLLWLKNDENHPLIAGSVFHYACKFFHPFADGNGRMGRLWQTLILARWNPLFLRIPVEYMLPPQQPDYGHALHNSTLLGTVTPFLEFMLSTIQNAVDNSCLRPASQATPHVSSQGRVQVASQSPAQTPPRDPSQVKPQLERLLRILSDAGQAGLSRKELQEASGLQNRKPFAERWLAKALKAGFVELTIPDKPTSRLQRYKMTADGRRAFDAQ